MVCLSNPAHKKVIFRSAIVYGSRLICADVIKNIAFFLSSLFVLCVTSLLIVESNVVDFLFGKNTGHTDL